MEDLLPFVERYGYWTLLAVGFAEYAGIPIVSVPVLVGAGALAAHGAVDPVLAAAAAAAGGLLADGMWYGLGRWQGYRLVGVACRLSSNPTACVVDVEDRVRRLGPGFVIPSKFLPGVGNLMAPAAGFAGVAASLFLLYDAVALSLWAGVYTGLGRIFSRHVAAVIEWIALYRDYALVAAVVLVVGAAVWRVAPGGHEDHPEPPDGGAEG